MNLTAQRFHSLLSLRSVMKSWRVALHCTERIDVF